MRLKRTLVILAITALTMGLLPMGNVIAAVSNVSIDTVGTPMTVKPGANDVQMMNINIASDSTSDTLVKLTVTYTGTDATDVSAVKLYDGVTLLESQSMTNGSAAFNVSKALAPSNTTTLTVKADIRSVPDGQVVKFRLEPGSVVLQGNGAEAAASTDPDHGVTVDGTPPFSPYILFPVVNMATALAAPIGGTAEPYAVVFGTITDSPGPHSTSFMATADGFGAWSATRNLSAFNDGTLTVTATATDGAGNVSMTSTKAGWKDTIALGTPTISVIPTSVNRANVTSFEVSGKAAAGATVELTITSSAGGTPVTAFMTVANGRYNSNKQILSSLADGTIRVTLTANDDAGNKSIETTATMTKDTVVDPPTVMTQHANAGNHTAWTLTGTAEAGATVSFWVTSDGGAGLAMGTATANWMTGVYSIPLDLTPLPDGNLTTTVSQNDRVDNHSEAAYGAAAIKDTVAPAMPTIGALTNANFANMLAVPISGTAEIGATVTITVTGTSGSAPATATADEFGDWYTTVNVSALPDGPMSATATATDAVGNVSVASTAYTTATKDAGVPAAPGTLVFAPVNNTNKAAAPISGKAEAGTTVSVIVSDAGAVHTTPAVTAPVNGSGDWSTVVDVSALTDGQITASVTVEDAAFNTSLAATVDSVKDIVAPAAPADLTLHVPMYVNASTNLAAVTIYGDAGNVEAGAKVYITLRVGLFSGFKMTTIANANGSWSKNVDVSSGGDKVMSVDIYQRDIAGNTSSTVTRSMTKDTMLPSVPTIDPLPTWVNSVNYEAVPVSGTAEAGSKVTITFTDSANVPQPKTVTAVGGVWSTTMDLTGLAEGALTMKVKATDDAGNTGGALSAPAPFKDTEAPAAPTASTIPTVYSGNTGSITISGTAQAGATVALTVDSANAGGTVSDSMTATGGTYSFTLNLSGLNDGLLTAKVTATDPAGNKSLATTKTATKDTVANIPVILGIPTVNFSNQAQVPFSGPDGSVEPGATVHITVEDPGGYTDTFNVTAASNGSWSTLLDLVDWADGYLTVTIWQTDAAGNISGNAPLDPSVKDTVLPTIALARVSYNNGNGPISTYQYYAWNRQAKITTSAPETVDWAWTVKDPFGQIVDSDSNATSGTSFTLFWAPAQYAASGNYTITLTATDLAGQPVLTPRTTIIPVYNYEFRVTGTRILNSTQTGEALSVTAGNDYYAEVTIENLNIAAATPEVVFQQSQGAVQAFTSAGVTVSAETTATYTFLWHPTIGSKSVDFFVWNHLAPAGREALSTQSHTTVTVN